MSDIFIKIGMSLLTKLITEKFVARIFLHTAYYLARKTEFKLDDTWVEETAAQWGVKLKP